MPKQTPIRAILYYLRRYIAADPQRRQRLQAEFKKASGANLVRNTLWRHLELHVEPPASTLLIYLTFLHRERAIKSGKRPGVLFTYSHPELLK